MDSDGDEGIRLGSCLFKLLIDHWHTSFAGTVAGGTNPSAKPPSSPVLALAVDSSEAALRALLHSDMYIVSYNRNKRSTTTTTTTEGLGEA